MGDRNSGIISLDNGNYREEFYSAGEEFCSCHGHLDGTTNNLFCTCSDLGGTNKDFCSCIEMDDSNNEFCSCSDMDDSNGFCSCTDLDSSNNEFCTAAVCPCSDLDGTKNEFCSCSEKEDNAQVDDGASKEYKSDSNKPDRKQADERLDCLTNEFLDDMQESIELVDKKMDEDESNSSNTLHGFREHQMQHTSANQVSNTEQERDSLSKRNLVFADEFMESDISENFSENTCYEDKKSDSLVSTSQSKTSGNMTEEKHIGVLSKQIGLVVGNRQLTSIVGSTLFGMTGNKQQKDKRKIQSRIRQRDPVNRASKMLGSHRVPVQSLSTQTKQNIGDNRNVLSHSSHHSKDTNKADLKEQESSSSIKKESCVPEEDRVQSDVKSSVEVEDQHDDPSKKYFTSTDESNPEAPTIGNVDDSRSQVKDDTDDLLIFILSTNPESTEDVGGTTIDTSPGTNDVFPIKGHIRDKAKSTVNLTDDGRRSSTHSLKYRQEQSTCDQSGSIPEDDALQDDIPTFHFISDDNHREESMEEINRNSNRKLSKEARSTSQECKSKAESKENDDLLDKNEDAICNYCLKHLHKFPSIRSDSEHSQRKELRQSDKASNHSENVEIKRNQFIEPVQQEVKERLDDSERARIPLQGNNIDKQMKSSRLSVRDLSDLIAGTEQGEVDATYTTKDSISIRINKHSDTDTKKYLSDKRPSFERSDVKGKRKDVPYDLQSNQPINDDQKQDQHLMKGTHKSIEETKTDALSQQNRTDKAEVLESSTLQVPDNGQQHSAHRFENLSESNQNSSMSIKREKAPQNESLNNHLQQDDINRGKPLNQVTRKSQEKLDESDEVVQAEGETNERIPSKQSRAPELSSIMSGIGKTETNLSIPSHNPSRSVKVHRASQEHYRQPTHEHDVGMKGKSLDGNQTFGHCLKYPHDNHDNSYYQSKSMPNMSTKDTLQDDLQTKHCRTGDKERSPSLARTNKNSDITLDSFQREERSGDIPSIKYFVQELSSSTTGSDTGMIDTSPPNKSMQNLSTKDTVQAKHCRNGDEKRISCLSATNQKSDRNLESFQREERSGDVIPSMKYFVQEPSSSTTGSDTGMIDTSLSSRSMRNLSTNISSKVTVQDDLQTKQIRNVDKRRSSFLARTYQNSDRKLDLGQREERSGDLIPSSKSVFQELSGSIIGSESGIIDATPTSRDSIYIRVDESSDQSDGKRSHKNVRQTDSTTNHFRKDGAGMSQPVKHKNQNSKEILDDEHQIQIQKAEIQYPDGSLCSSKSDLPRNLKNLEKDDIKPLIPTNENYQRELTDQYQREEVTDTTAVKLSISDESDAMASIDIAEADDAFVNNPLISIRGNTGMSDTWSQKKHFYDMWTKGKFCDVNIVVDGQVFLVHRVVLAANSEYFEKFFLDSPARNYHADVLSVVVTEMSADIFRIILQYMYTGHIDIQQHQVSKLLTASLFLLIKSLTSALQEYLLKTWKGDCIRAFCLAQTAGLHDLDKVILNYIRTHFVEVLTSEHFALCPAEHVSTILSDDNLSINEETDVLYAVLLWLEHHTRDISSNLRLLRHVRFEYIPLATIDRIEKGHLKSLTNESVKRYIHDARRRASCLAEHQLHFDPPIIRKRMSEVVECHSVKTNGSQSIESTNIDVSFQASEEEHINPSKNNRASADTLYYPPVMRQHISQEVECRSLKTNGSQSIESTNIDRSFEASEDEQVNLSRNSRTSVHSLNKPPVIRQRVSGAIEHRSFKTNGSQSIGSTNIGQSFQTSEDEQVNPPVIGQRIPGVVEFRSLRAKFSQSIKSSNIDRSFQAMEDEQVNPSKHSRTSADSLDEWSIFPSKSNSPTFSKSRQSLNSKSTPFPSYHEIDTNNIRVSVSQDQAANDATATYPVVSGDDLTGSSSMDASVEDESSVEVVRIGGISRTWKEDCVHNDIEKLENGRGGKRWEDWTSFAELPVAMHHHAACYIHNSIYISGGHVQLPCDASSSHFHPSRVFHVYDLMKGKWYRLADLEQARVFHQMVALFGQLYVIGGQGPDGGALSGVERYSPYTDSWRHVAPISFPRYATAAAAYNFHLWVAGGASNHVTSSNADSHQERIGEEGGTNDYDGFYKSTSTFITATVECYSPHNNSWTKIKDLPSPRCHAALMRINKRLYLVGGFGSIRHNPADDTCFTSSVDVLDDVIESWRYVTDIEEGNYSANTVVVGSKIVILGKPGPFLESSGDVISIFDTLTDKWELRRSQHLEARVGHACCAIPEPPHRKLCQRRRSIEDKELMDLT